MKTAKEWLGSLPLNQRIDVLAGGTKGAELAYIAGLAEAAASDCNQLAQQIADSTAKSDIEIYCECVLLDNHQWYDTVRTPSDDVEWVDQARRYLDLRGLLIRHPQHPHLVRWEIGRAVEQKQ